MIVIKSVHETEAQNVPYNEIPRYCHRHTNCLEPHSLMMSIIVIDVIINIDVTCTGDRYDKFKN